MITISVKEAQTALLRAGEQGALAGMQLGAQLAREQQEAEKAAVLAKAAAEQQAVVTTLTAEISAMEELVADVTASAVLAEKALQVRISSLQQQLGGTNWLAARGQVSKAQSEAHALKAQSAADQAKIKELNHLSSVGARLRAKGGELRVQLSSESQARGAILHDELATPLAVHATSVGLTERRVNQLVSHIEEELFVSGAGNVGRTRLLVAALLKRPAVQRLLGRHDSRMEKLARTASEMLDHAKGVLKQLTVGKRGSRTLADHERFETIITALVPDSATEDGMMRTIGDLLGIHWEQIDRAQKRQLADDGLVGAFSRATKISRKQRNDYYG